MGMITDEESLHEGHQGTRRERLSKVSEKAVFRSSSRCGARVALAWPAVSSLVHRPYSYSTGSQAPYGNHRCRLRFRKPINTLPKEA